MGTTDGRGVSTRGARWESELPACEEVLQYPGVPEGCHLWKRARHARGHGAHWAGVKTCMGRAISFMMAEPLFTPAGEMSTCPPPVREEDSRQAFGFE